MSKRLIRSFAPQLPAHLPILVAHEVHVVLYNGKTFFGRLESFTHQSLLLCDLRGHEHHILLADVEEIIRDQVSLL